MTTLYYVTEELANFIRQAPQLQAISALWKLYCNSNELTVGMP